MILQDIYVAWIWPNVEAHCQGEEEYKQGLSFEIRLQSWAVALNSDLLLNSFDSWQIHIAVQRIVAPAICWVSQLRTLTQTWSSSI
jgi:hypothetical protein